MRTLFREGNLGCRNAVSSAITWFFGQEPEGIILEDDCLPSPSFFPYCAELLKCFRDDERVMCITGDSFQRDMSGYPYSYYFSKYNHVWGWATWRRAWRCYDDTMKLYPEYVGGNFFNRFRVCPAFQIIGETSLTKYIIGRWILGIMYGRFLVGRTVA